MLCAALAAVFVCFCYLTLLPEPVVIQVQVGEATVYVSANRHYLLLPGECVTLRWDVEHIKAVYLNGQGQVGSGEAVQCLTVGDVPEVRIVFQDDSEQRYPLNVEILSQSSLGYVLLVGGLAFSIFLLAGWLRNSDRTRRIRVVRNTFLIVVLTVGFWLQGYSLSQTIALANWPGASQALKNLLTLTGIFIALILIIMLIQETDTIQSRSVANVSWFIGSGVVIAFVVGTILYVNPRGMYFNNHFEPNQLLLRSTKMDAYLTLPTTPDMLVLGSSRAFTLSPAHIHDRVGYSAFNMAVEGGRIEDMLIQTRQIIDERKELPKVLLLEVQEGLPREPNDVAERAPYSWLPYMQSDTALLMLQRRFERVFDLNQLAEAIYIERYNPLYTREPKEWPQFNADGSAERLLRSPSEFEYALQMDIGGLQPVRCENINAESQVMVNQLIHIADEQHSALVFYISALHPRYIDTVLRNNADYQRCHSVFLTYMEDLTATHANVFFLDFSSLNSIDGDASEKGYYDAQHITRENAAHLIESAADTIKHAYAAAHRS
jgi:hypothetical protein